VNKSVCILWKKREDVRRKFWENNWGGYIWKGGKKEGFPHLSGTKGGPQVYEKKKK